MPKNEKKNQQFLASAPRFFVSEGAEQIWGQLEYLAAQIFEKKSKNLQANSGNFPIQIDGNGRK